MGRLSERTSGRRAGPPVPPNARQTDGAPAVRDERVGHEVGSDDRLPSAGRARTGHRMSAPSEAFRRGSGDPTREHPVQQLDGPLKELLAGKKILMTGVTGFIGEQLLWKILTELPDTTPAVLVRRKRSQGAWERMVAVVKKDIFADARN